MVAMSIFFIGIIASKARVASPPPAASASVSARGVICQERPQRSLHQPHWLSLMLSEGAGFSDGTIAAHVDGPDGLAITRGYMEGSKFHNGQIVGPLETAPRNTTPVAAGGFTRWRVGHRRVLIPLTRADVHRIASKQFPPTTFLNNDVLSRVTVSHGV